MPSEPTRHQLSSRLAYRQTAIPPFIQKLRNQIEGVFDDKDDDKDDDFDQWQASSGRPPIPQRPAVPERPDDDPGSADEDDDDEKPQVVVLKQGKHMTALEAANEKRKDRGLPPLSSKSELSEETVNSTKPVTSPSKPKESEKLSLSFTSSGAGPRSTKKRKAPAHVTEEFDELDVPKVGKGPKKRTKKAGGASTLLSFGDGDDT